MFLTFATEKPRFFGRWTVPFLALVILFCINISEGGFHAFNK
jgi:hypothetical protein